MDPKLLRSVMGQFATGVTVVTFNADGQPAGMTVNAFMSVSLDPPLILVSIRNTSRFNQFVGQGVRYGVNFLAESQRWLSGHFGGRPQEGANLPFIYRKDTPLLDGSLVQLVARTVDVHPAGDHLLYIGEIEHLSIGEQRKPLLFFGGRYHQMHGRAPSIEWRGGTDGW
ncbi:flavin reductase family protein [Zestomonas thermotolerans]|jgi:flavin reductase (DIM6/NTAB) family NADH-FMN oxidoreductase RutF|uniref:flavin reductase family protein n=1 Tax=Zestomonas thermotolerans TaxID=157784 RepID=UPI0004870DD9|nr:flavin reductase family protein [Pseudomonas thermotolerans]MBO2511741.1 flavin reductase [Gammaproteobacteria bacterium]